MWIYSLLGKNLYPHIFSADGTKKKKELNKNNCHTNYYFLSICGHRIKATIKRHYQ